MLEGFILAHQPQHADEFELLADAAYCKWRQKRLWNVETSQVEMTIAVEQHELQRKLPKANVAAHVANAIQNNAEGLHPVRTTTEHPSPSVSFTSTAPEDPPKAA